MITTELWMSPLSLSHLIIRIKIELTHFYSCKYEIKLGSGNVLYHSSVLFIGPNKRQKDYNAPSIYYIENKKVWVAGSDAACHIDPSVFNFIPTQPP
jgi:hypothetical protein